MVASPFIFGSSSPEETAHAAALLARALAPGDVILLAGDVGAGKTHFARHLIQSILLVEEDVPSPTFTLVQTYETSRGPLWHSDLYRIGSTHELEELGLFDAFETAICLIEWPDRLGAEAPSSALTLTISATAMEAERRIEATWSDPQWSEKLSVWSAL